MTKGEGERGRGKGNDKRMLGGELDNGRSMNSVLVLMINDSGSGLMINDSATLAFVISPAPLPIGFWGPFTAVL